MNQENNLSLPRENTAGGRIITRRNFLRLAGASALALPFLKPEEALATPGFSAFLPGCGTSIADDYHNAGIPIWSIRHYSAQGTVPSSWPRVDNSKGKYNSNKQPIPVCLTVYPRWQIFYANGAFNGFDKEFKALAKSAIPGDMISCFQEPENIHHKTAHYENGVITSWDSITPWKIQHIQHRMYSIAHNLNEFSGGDASNNMRVGGIAFYRRSWSGGWSGCKSPTDFMMHGMDWYGLDCYRQHIPAKGPGNVITALEAYKSFASNYGGSGWSLCIPECNAPAELDSKRSYYFNIIADWVANSAGRPNYRAFLPFWNPSGNDSGPFVGECVERKKNSSWPQTAYCEGKHSKGSWGWRNGASTATINALKGIANM